MRIALLLALALLLSVAGCGSDTGSPDGDRPPADAPTTTEKGGGYDYP